MKFKRCLSRLLDQEGGYVNDPSDSGGETYKGISRKWFPKWAGWGIIDTYTDKEEISGDWEVNDLVAQFYSKHFWNPLRLDEVHDELIAEMLFSTAVNLGKKVAIRKMQRVLGVTPDGIIGPKTLLALNGAEAVVFTNSFVLELVDFYLAISVKGNNAKFLKGWVNRAMSFYYRRLSTL